MARQVIFYEQATPVSSGLSGSMSTRRAGVRARRNGTMAQGVKSLPKPDLQVVVALSTRGASVATM